MGRSRYGRAKVKIMQDAKSGLYSNIIPYIKQGGVIPVISNSFYIQQIFEDESEVQDAIPEIAQFDDEDLTEDEAITREWADIIGYPMTDNHKMARVAQYHLVEEAKGGATSPIAREKYITFMKEFLLRVFEDGEEYSERTQELKPVIMEKSFSDLVAGMEFPKFSDRSSGDVLHILAKLPLPFYITTSYYDFLERALRYVGKEPITQICFWSGEPKNLKAEHRPNNKVDPTPQNPMVYHLYGLEDYPETLTLSEDDYMNFLINVMGNQNSSYPLVPLKLVGKLGESQLLLLGYQLQDWDFRVLFRFLLKFRQKRRIELQKRMDLEKGMVIQLKELNKKEMGDEVKTIEYLREYYDQENFEVMRKDVEVFIQELWNEWNPERQGE